MMGRGQLDLGAGVASHGFGFGRRAGCMRRETPPVDGPQPRRTESTSTQSARTATGNPELKAAGLHGHKYAIDAILAAVAGREAVQGAEATVFTSDTDDMAQLLAGHSVRVEKV